jgi:quinolinate synthase
MGENLHQLFTYMANDMTDEQIAAVHSAHNKASIRNLLSRFNYFGQGICVVHHMFGQKVVDRVRNEHPDAYYTAHFEVPGEMFQLAMEAQQKGEGVVGSTSGILNFIVEKVQNAATDSKLKFVLGTEAGMITPLVKAIQEVLSNKPGQNIEAEIIFPVSSEAVAQDHDFGVVPGVASGEGCSVSGGCATCPFMKMNSLNSLSDLLELIGSPESSRLLGYYPKVYNEMINGISAFELGTLPIHHMREYGQKKYFGDVLLNDVVTRNNPTVQKDEEVQKNDENKSFA